MGFELAVILALVVVNGVLAGAEIAVVGVRRTRIRELIDDGNQAARSLEQLRSQPETFLATVQIGITVVGATAAAFGGSQLSERISPWLQGLPLIGDWAGEVALGLVVGAVSFLSLVVGELVPKSLALRAAEPYALVIGRPLLALSRIASPLVRLLTASSNLVLRLFGDHTSFSETRLSPEELRQMLDEAATVGSLNPRATEIATRALDLGGLRVCDVMVPTRAVIALPKSATQEEAVEVLIRVGHSRIPVYEVTIDNIVGYVRTRDALSRTAQNRPLVLEELLQPAHFVPESSLAIDLLQGLMQRRQHLAFVVDEHGGLAGIVTLEDLLEELVGDILSELEVLSPTLIQHQPDGTVLVHGTTPIREVNRELDLDLPEGEGSSTIAGLVLKLAGRIPPAGECLQSPDGSILEVMEASSRRVRSVRLSPPAPESPGETA